MEVSDSLVVPVVLNVDIGAQSSMFCCTICLELVQVPDKHRQCCECGNTICTDCITRLVTREKCPTCRAQTRFVVNRLIHREIYPMVLKKCKWTECAVKMLHVDVHSARCEWREVKCPVCKVATPTKSIHAHLASKCILPWGTAKRGTPEDFAEELKNVPNLPSGNYFRVFNLTPPGFDIKPEDERIIYFWRMNGSKLGFVRIICIQLCAGPNETIEFARSSRGKIYVLPIQSMHCSSLIHKRVETKDIAKYTRIGINPSLHKLEYGSRHVVNCGNESFACTLIDFTWNPTCAVFIHARGSVYNIDVLDIIECPHQEQKEQKVVEPIVYLPEPDSLAYEPNAFSGLFVNIDYIPPLEDDMNSSIPESPDSPIESSMISNMHLYQPPGIPNASHSYYNPNRDPLSNISAHSLSGPTTQLDWDFGYYIRRWESSNQNEENVD